MLNINMNAESYLLVRGSWLINNISPIYEVTVVKTLSSGAWRLTLSGDDSNAGRCVEERGQGEFHDDFLYLFETMVVRRV